MALSSTLNKRYQEYLKNAGIGGVSTRGEPEPDALIHLKRDQGRDKPGFREGRDFNLNTICWQGNWHIRYTRDDSLVTCPECLERLHG